MHKKPTKTIFGLCNASATRVVKAVGKVGGLSTMCFDEVLAWVQIGDFYSVFTPATHMVSAQANAKFSPVSQEFSTLSTQPIKRITKYINRSI